MSSPKGDSPNEDWWDNVPAGCHTLLAVLNGYGALVVWLLGENWSTRKICPPLTPCPQILQVFFTRMEMSGVRNPYSSFSILGESSAIIVFHVT